MESYTSLRSLADLSRSVLVHSHTLGGRLIRLHNDRHAATKCFVAMGREIRSFYHSYQALYPKVQDSSFLSPTCLLMVQRISDDITTVFQGIDDGLDLFERREGIESHMRRHRRPNFWLFGKSTKALDRNGRILRFLEENHSTLRRSYIRYAELLLKLVLAVIIYAQETEPSAGALNINNYHNYLIQDVTDDLRTMRQTEDELRRNNWDDHDFTRASEWWDGLAPRRPGAPAVNPLEELARLWVNPEARFVLGPNAELAEFEFAAQRLRDQYEEQLQRFIDHTRREHAVELEQVNTAREAERLRYEEDRVHWETHRRDFELQMGEIRQTVDALRKEVQTLTRRLDAEKRSRNDERQQNQQREARLRRERTESFHAGQTERVKAEKAQQRAEKAEIQARRAEQELGSAAMVNRKLEKQNKLLQKEIEVYSHRASQPRHHVDRTASSTHSTKPSTRSMPTSSSSSFKRNGPPMSYYNALHNRAPSLSGGSTTAMEDDDHDHAPTHGRRRSRSRVSHRGRSGASSSTEL